MRKPDVNGLIQKYQSLESLAKSMQLMASKVAKEANKARVELERFSAPAPKGANRINKQIELATEIVLKRNQRIGNAKTR